MGADAQETGSPGDAAHPHAAHPNASGQHEGVGGGFTSSSAPASFESYAAPPPALPPASPAALPPVTPLPPLRPPRSVATIRRNLFYIVIAALIPIGLFTSVLFHLLWQGQQEARDQEQLARVRTMAAVVQSELNSTVQRLELLARSPLLAPDTMPAYYAQLQLLLPDNEDWANLLLISRDEQIINARIPYGTSLPRLGDMPYQTQAFATGKPVASDLFRARTRPVDTLDVAVPVMRDGKAQYLLIASLKSEHFSIVMRDMMGRSDGITSLYDRNMRFIARTREHATFLGDKPSDWLAANMRSAPEGVTRSRSKEGIPVYSAWRRLDNGWTIATGVPTAATQQALAQSIGLLVLLWLLALLTGLVMARVLYRRIDRGMQATVEVAQLRAQGEPAAFPKASFNELVELSAAIDTLFEQERRARGEAEAASAAKDEFLAMLGHELRNPIGAITNASHLLEREEPGSEGDALARRVIARQAANMKRMIDDLLDMSRVLSGKISLHARPIDMAACVRASLETLATAGKTGGHKIELHAETLWINGDPARIDQIVANLVSNAVNYTPPGRRIRVELARGTARPVLGPAGAAAISRHGDAVLTVTDEGIGISAQTLPKIFDLFFQEKQQADRPKSGLGLGLTLVRRLATLHGGTVEAASAGEGAGAAFTVRLPAIETPLTPVEKPAPMTTKNRRVFLIEDNADARDTLSTLLEIEGHTVASAEDGPAGLEALKNFSADAIIVDVGLPGMDGYEVARAIRAAGQLGPNGGPAFLIALTGYGLPEDQKRAHEAGFDAHLVKPADFDKLAALLEKSGTRG